MTSSGAKAPIVSLLYVDDEPDLLELTKLALERSGDFTVTTATSVPEAIRLLLQQPYDAIVSDYQMPGMNGIELLKAVRARRDKTPFIIFTGKGREEIVIEAFENGADFYIQKGGDPKAQFAELAHKVKRAVQHRIDEKALQKSEARYRAVVEDQTELICRFTPDGKLTFVNDAYCRYFSLEKDRCLSRPHSVVLPPEDARLMKLHLALLTPQNPVATIEHRIIMPSGEVRWQRWNDRAIFDRSGHVAEYQSVGRDTTEQKIAEVALQESEAHFSTIFEKSPVAICITRIDNGMLIDVNPAVLTMFGYTRDELIGHTTLDLNIWAVPEEREKLIGQLRNQGRIKNIETHFQKKTGEIGDLLVSAEIIEIAGSQYMLSLMQDITKRKRAEEELQNSYAFLNNLIDQSPTPMWISDENGTLIRINTACCNILNISEKEVVGKYNILNDNIVEEQGFLPLVRNVFDEGQVAHFQIIYDTAKLKPLDLARQASVILEVTIFPVRDAKGKITNAVIQHINITERKRAEEALRIQHNLALTLTTCHTMKEALEHILDAALHAEGLDSGGIYVTDPATGALDIVVHHGLSAEFVEHTSHFDADAPQVRRAKTGTAFYGRYADLRQPGKDEIRDREGITAMASIPVLQEGNLVALMNMASHIHDDISFYARELLETLAAQISGALVYIRSEEALQESEKKWRSLVSYLPDYVALLDQEGRFLFLNHYAEGFTEEEVFGSSVYDYFSPPSAEIFKKEITECQNTGKIRKFEHTAMGDHGLMREYEDYLVPILEKNKATTTLVISRDITERKQAEAGLRESEERFRQLFERSNAVMILIEPGSGAILEANQAAADFYGYTRKTLGAMRMDDIVLLPAEQIAEARRKVTHKEQNYFILPHRLADGTIRTVEAYSSPIEIGRRPYLFTIVHDITERKRAEDALQKERKRFYEVLETLPAMICLLTPDYHVAFANRGFREKFGESHGRYCYDYCFGRKETCEFCETYTVLKTGKPHHWEVKGPDSSIIDVYDFPFTDSDGSSLILEMAIDITDRKEAEEALRQANRQLNLLTNITRHDILNQLMALRGYLELSQDVLDNPEKLSEYMKKEQHAANAIEQQITFTRVYQELGAAAPRWQNVNASIQKAVARLPMREVHVEVDRTNLEIFADPLFEKVFYNLIDNAIRYGGDQMKTISISSQKSDQGLTLVCEDDGVGITEEDKEHLFTRGFGKNTGLGLFLAREILSITGITIIENGIPGKGARFEITVPKGMYRSSSVS